MKRALEWERIDQMEILEQYGKDDLATVYLGRTEDGQCLEFVESLQPPFRREEKMVMIISTLHGCPVGCIMCDAGNAYQGKVSAKNMFEQIDHVVSRHFPDGNIFTGKFKVQFSRMGEPAFNDDVLILLDEFPSRYRAPGFIPSISTVAPAGRKDFFNRLLEIKKKHYPQSFQLQFSIHSTDPNIRDRIIPIKKMTFREISSYAERFHDIGGKKVTLNFILARNFTLDVDVLRKTFSPEYFFIKMTPLNPTYMANKNQLTPGIRGKTIEEGEGEKILKKIEEAGFSALLSIGEQEENRIGSNCGQYVETYLRSKHIAGNIEKSYDSLNYS